MEQQINESKPNVPAVNTAGAGAAHAAAEEAKEKAQGAAGLSPPTPQISPGAMEQRIREAEENANMRVVQDPANNRLYIQEFDEDGNVVYQETYFFFNGEFRLKQIDREGYDPIKFRYNRSGLAGVSGGARQDAGSNEQLMQRARTGTMTANDRAALAKLRREDPQEFMAAFIATMSDEERTDYFNSLAGAGIAGDPIGAGSALLASSPRLPDPIYGPVPGEVLENAKSQVEIDLGNGLIGYLIEGQDGTLQYYVMPFSTSTVADIETLLGPDERWFWEKLLGRVAKGGGKLVGLQRVGGPRYWAVLAKGQDGSDKVLFLDAMDPASKKLLADLQARLRGETYYGRYWEVEPDRDFARRVAENLGPAGVSIVLLSSALVGDDETFLVGVENGKTEVLWAGGGLVGGIAGKKSLGRLFDAADKGGPIGGGAGRGVTKAGEEIRNIRVMGWSKGKEAGHFADHAAEMGITSQRAYTQAAKDLATKSKNVIESKVGNTLFKYDKDTGNILIINGRNRKIKTFYRAAHGVRSFKEAMQRHLQVLRNQQQQP